MMPTDTERLAALEKYVDDHKKLDHINVHAIRVKLKELDDAVTELKLQFAVVLGIQPDK
jgi:hypothetical protein